MASELEDIRQGATAFRVEANLYKKLYEEVNSERKEITNRVQEFAGLIKKEPVKFPERQVGSREPVAVKRYIPWRQQQRILAEKLAEAQTKPIVETVHPEGVISGT